ncbi:hypothetical protein HY029_01090 [Candidatus Gottesmanbacteria bacterium]|nr:hypothetical protein [Candidatus Gottesmanbacteria bacterium]
MDPDQLTPNIPVKPPLQPFTSPPPRSTPKSIFILGGLLILIAGLFGGYYLTKSSTSEKPKSQLTGKACTQEAKLCPDGSSVSRTGINCEFAPCPQITITSSPTPDLMANWKTYSNSKLNFSAKYPPKWFITEYQAGIGIGQNSLGSIALYDSLATQMKSSDKAIFISVAKINKNWSLDQWAKETKETLGLTTKIRDEYIDSIPALRVSGEFDFPKGNSKVIYVFTKKNEMGWIIYTIPKSGSPIPEFDQILSTFKFLDQNQNDLNSYTACGCGCCGGTIPQEVCLYKSKGDSLEKVKQNDFKAKTSSQCMLVGCSMGITYRYCD